MWHGLKVIAMIAWNTRLPRGGKAADVDQRYADRIAASVAPTRWSEAAGPPRAGGRAICGQGAEGDLRDEPGAGAGAAGPCAETTTGRPARWSTTAALAIPSNFRASC